MWWKRLNAFLMLVVLAGCAPAAGTSQVANPSATQTAAPSRTPWPSSTHTPPPSRTPLPSLTASPRPSQTASPEPSATATRLPASATPTVSSTLAATATLTATEVVAGDLFERALVLPDDLPQAWVLGEADEVYEEVGRCRTLYAAGGDPPAIYNCIFTVDFYDLERARSYYDERQYVEASLRTGYRYEGDYFIILDYVGDAAGGAPRYALGLEQGGYLITVDLINPPLAFGAGLAESFTPVIDELLYQIAQLNLARLEGEG